MSDIPGLCSSCDDTRGRCIDKIRQTGERCCAACTHDDERDRIIQSNDVAGIVQTHAEAFIPLTQRYAIADALWDAGLRLPAHSDTEHITDDEWRRFQAIPEQGYSHRHWVNTRISERIAAERRRLLDPDTIVAARVAVHRALAPEWMSVVTALGGDQDAYERLLADIATAVLVSASAPSTQR